MHSNLDDGFAGLLADMSSALGMVLIEKYIVEALIGGRLAHCYGHHFTAPLVPLAFHQALVRLTDTPGSMIFGATISYRGQPAGNFASLANYLQADIWALLRHPSGHAVDPVPVTETSTSPTSTRSWTRSCSPTAWCSTPPPVPIWSIPRRSTRWPAG